MIKDSSSINPRLRWCCGGLNGAAAVDAVCRNGGDDAVDSVVGWYVDGDEDDSVKEMMELWWVDGGDDDGVLVVEVRQG
ncbi:hypothetical protein Tco_0428369 [Tanacetum coccineum]